jgi:hypothetical protein
VTECQCKTCNLTVGFSLHEKEKGQQPDVRWVSVGQRYACRVSYSRRRCWLCRLTTCQTDPLKIVFSRESFTVALS